MPATHLQFTRNSGTFDPVPGAGSPLDAIIRTKSM